MGGHLHDGGLRLSLRDLTAKKPLFTSRATYDMPGERWYLTRMSSLSTPDGPTVTAGDRLRLTAVYDSTHAWQDVMGIMAGYMVEQP
jgi:hypothetical protein